MQVWFEPYTMAFFQDFQFKQRTGSYLPNSADDFDSKDFMRQKRLHAQGTSLEHLFNLPSVDETLILRDSVRRQLSSIPAGESVFVKDMAYGVTDFLDLLPTKDSGFQHIFLIRNPKKVFPAWRRLILAQLTSDQPPAGQAPTFDDETTFDMTSDVPYMMPGYSYKCQYDLWRYVKENINPNPIVIDADDILSDPLTMLSKFTDATKMPFNGSASLSWDARADVVSKWRCFIPLANARPDDFIYRTHSKSIFSSCFERRVNPKQPGRELSSDVIKCIEATMPYYMEMAQYKLT
ncbi:uncharacterized protein LOC105445821 isoform X2 [Strongylocentrotus purpuratus]|uniref:Uncharacterized protein n=1 Tax=Strongylocentrotus purpuratus TaxID=7668 RepID=A0A7M7NEW4_STRPU|nr:uncharacterized protein LOC105445821 isoform X2 [Strongylocentrotus purpuratus]